MKTKVLSVIAAASLTMTAFAAFAVNAGAAEGNTVYLSELSGDYEAKNGDILTGKLETGYKLTIADGATVTLDGVYIYGDREKDEGFAGIIPLGDATIVLKGKKML